MSSAKQVSPAEIVAALARPTIPPMEFQKLGIVDLSLNGVYQACVEYLKDPNAGRGIECIRLGRKFMIVTAPWRRMYAMDAPPSANETAA